MRTFLYCFNAFLIDAQRINYYVGFFHCLIIFVSMFETRKHNFGKIILLKLDKTDNNRKSSNERVTRSKHKHDDIIWLNSYNTFSISDAYLYFKEHRDNKQFF